MGRIASILTRVRDSLADPNADRWSDARLLRLIDEAQVHIAVRNNLLRTKATFGVTADKAVYSLPADAARLTRAVLIDGSRLPIKSHADMDLIDPTWEITTGSTVEYLVFDKLNPGEFKLYPIPTVTPMLEGFTFSSNYGAIVTIEDDIIINNYGALADITDTATLTSDFNTPYGLVADIGTLEVSIIIYFNRRPVEINAIDTVESYLEIHDIYDKALKHYAIGMAWRDDQDTQNRQLGKEELSFYIEEFKESKDNSASDNLAKSLKHTTYNDGFR